MDAFSQGFQFSLQAYQQVDADCHRKTKITD